MSRYKFTDNKSEINIYKKIVDNLDLSLRDLSQIKLSFILLEKESKTSNIIEKFPKIITFFMLALKQKYYSEYCRILTSNEYINILKVMDKIYSYNFTIKNKKPTHNTLAKVECLPSEIYDKLKYQKNNTYEFDNNNKEDINNIIFTVSYLIFRVNTDIPTICNQIYNINSYLDKDGNHTKSFSKNDYTEYLSSILLLSPLNN